CAGDPIVSGDIISSYRRISSAFVEGLRRLGAEPEADKRADGHPNAKGPVCFEVPSHYEITLDGKKLVGSAQVRKFGAVLQHGTLPLTGDIARICDALVFPSDEARAEARARVYQRATTLESSLGRVVPWDEAAEVIAAAFADTFNLTFEVTDALAPQEAARAEELTAGQYASAEWNGRFSRSQLGSTGASAVLRVNSIDSKPRSVSSPPIAPSAASYACSMMPSSSAIAIRSRLAR